MKIERIDVKSVEALQCAQEELAEAKSRARKAAQTLIDTIGASGPENVEETAERAAKEIKRLRAEVERLRPARFINVHPEHQIYYTLDGARKRSTSLDNFIATVGVVELENKT